MTGGAVCALVRSCHVSAEALSRCPRPRVSREMGRLPSHTFGSEHVAASQSRSAASSVACVLLHLSHALTLTSVSDVRCDSNIHILLTRQRSRT